ncbi:Thioredoxin-2, partial [Blattella germanica]
NQEFLSQEFPDIHILKIDVDECEELTVDYEIQDMPTIKKKKTLESFTGANIEQVKHYS